MSKPSDTASARLAALRQACSRIAPNWPLDQLIAVNPWWGWRDQSFADASARLAALGHVRCLMPADYYQSLWQTSVQSSHLQSAAAELGVFASVDELLNVNNERPPRCWYNVSDLVDAQRPPSAMSWHEEIVHQLSQFCGDLRQQSHADELDSSSVYQAWLDVVRADRGLAILMREPRLTEVLAALSNGIEELVQRALDDLAFSPQQISDYGLALLLDINGWSASFAWLSWQATLKGKENDALFGLLAARLAWDWVLWQLHRNAEWQLQWQQQWYSLPSLVANHAEQQKHILLWQRAAEIASQEKLIKQLGEPWPMLDSARPALQAAFCIDVRSEPMRRALEAQHAGIQTLGFAGFFGLPLAYRPATGDFIRPQLPGLLAPSLEAHEAGQLADRRHGQAGQRQQWQRFTASAPTTFTAVESGGLFYLFKLLKQSLFPAKPGHPVNQISSRAVFEITRGNEPLSLEDKAGLAAGILHAMGLTEGLAQRVLLVGHGSTSSNNPHAAGLDCGACGGQTGDINARVLAQLLNDSQVRTALVSHGIDIPADTRFIAALHDTTTDEVHCFPQHSGDLDTSLCNWLELAGEQVRQERAPALGLSQQTKRSVIRRSRDWSQVRPEWGLAGNHSFIVAPRQRTRHLNLAGRSFLHDYCWQRDAEFSLLELIMTAPMVVTHWINMQYNASVTDPVKFGSGNKVLHNVVGGNLGVFEGNGGDLRIGLPLQSVHDGERWMHEPLRLSVFIAAPEAAIIGVYQRHETVRQLLDNDWLTLFRLGDEPGVVSQMKKGGMFL